MADKENGVKRLSKYTNLATEPDSPRWQTTMSKTKDAIRQANIAEGKGPAPINDLYVSDETEGRLTKTGKEVMARERQRVDELADQYKRETRGVKDDSLRGKIREITGMKKGGKVSSASKRADGIAQRGKTKGRMV